MLFWHHYQGDHPMLTDHLSPTVHLTTNRNNLATKLHRDFQACRGADLVAAALKEAGLKGRWDLTIDRGFRASSHTPRLQVCRPATDRRYELYLKVKPGDNGTAARCKLHIDKNKNISAQALFEKLAVVVEGAHEETPVYVSEGLLEDDVQMGLVAVQVLTTNKAWGSRRAFLEAAGKELGYDNTTPAAILFATLTEQGYLEETEHAWRLTLKGHTFIKSDTELESENGVVLSSGPPVTPGGSAESKPQTIPAAAMTNRVSPTSTAPAAPLPLPPIPPRSVSPPAASPVSVAPVAPAPAAPAPAAPKTDKTIEPSDHTQLQKVRDEMHRALTVMDRLRALRASKAELRKKLEDFQTKTAQELKKLDEEERELSLSFPVNEIEEMTFMFRTLQEAIAHDKNP
jgi:hypothetical protein